MEKYESKQYQICKPVEAVFPLISNFTLLTPALQDKVEQWHATEDTCSFKVKGFNINLKMEEKIENKHVKIVGDGGVPMDFSFWIQMVSVSPLDTRMRMVLHVELNFALRMMIGSKLKDGIDKAAQMFAEALNR